VVAACPKMLPPVVGLPNKPVGGLAAAEAGGCPKRPAGGLGLGVVAPA
jgi:hypothetical protein